MWNLPTIPVLDINFIIMNNKEEKLKKLLFGIINKLSKDADVYHHNGSLWLIHTEDRKWIVEYTKQRTLWFNYNFFRSAFKFVSLDINDKNEYVTEWFELRFLNKPKVEDTHLAMNNYSEDIVDAIENGVKDTSEVKFPLVFRVEDTIQNGVKHTHPSFGTEVIGVEDTIQNGVKHTEVDEHKIISDIEDVIQNGVKETVALRRLNLLSVEDTIQNGVKDETIQGWDFKIKCGGTIQNGVRDTHQIDWERNNLIEDTIQNGVKKTDFNMYRDNNAVEDTIQNGVKETRNNRLPRTVHVMNTIINGVKVAKPMDEWVNTERIVDEVVKDGVKETQPLPAQDGNMDWGNYYHGKEDRTKPFNEYLDEAIRFGVKETYDDCSDNIARVEGIIRVGKKIDKDGI